MKKAFFILLNTVFLLLAFKIWAESGIVVYVNDDAAGDGNGSSWLNAYTDLQSAIDSAKPNDEVWVAAGIYKPGVEDRSEYFQMAKGVSIYGGFSGDEDPATFNIINRDFISNATVLSGDIGAEGDDTDNCYHVFYHSGDLSLDETAVLDGFTVTGGKADGDNVRSEGGGMYNVLSSPIIRNCTFVDNYAVEGGGMHNVSSSPVLTNCIFVGNSALEGGGGMCGLSSSSVLTNCLFSDNTVSYGYGGGMYNGLYCSPKLMNCTFSGNRGLGGHDGMSGRAVTSLSSTVLTNCIFWGDTSGEDHIYNDNATPSVTFSCVQGGTGQAWFGTGCLDINPEFVDATNGDFNLLPSSPCINTGNPDTTTSDAGFEDLAGNPRIGDARIDMGAYEFNKIPPPPPPFIPIPIPVLHESSITDSILKLEIDPFPESRDGVVHLRTQWRLYDSGCDENNCDKPIILNNYTDKGHAILKIPMIIFDDYNSNEWQTRFEVGFSSNTFLKKWSQWAWPGSMPYFQAIGFDEVEYDTDLDSNGVSDKKQDEFKVIKTYDGNAEIGFKIKSGYSFAFKAIQAIKPESFDDDSESRFLPFGLVSFKIDGISEDSNGEVEVEIYFSIPMPDGSKLYCYSTEKGVLEAMEDIVFNEKGTCVTLKVEDGGRGDFDGIANKTIVHTSGIGLKNSDESQVIPDGGSMDVGGIGCFIGVAGTFLPKE
ncbi:choice-of-anchor U domain-containing protein [Desulfoluna sp.]|uniref:choice-of-anchor U domain-containing protein n=1 Tax=Desulfoluna sp. TaxID=2045199 RepID=UPI0026096583|nr:choice-of-anchor U domain-containing protein [Desulfoluna sp.]